MSKPWLLAILGNASFIFATVCHQTCTYEFPALICCSQVEEKLNYTVEKLQQQLMEEQNARLEAEKVALEARMKSEEEIQKLKESLRKARLENEEFRKMAESKKCAIL